MRAQVLEEIVGRGEPFAAIIIGHDPIANVRPIVNVVNVVAVVAVVVMR